MKKKNLLMLLTAAFVSLMPLAAKSKKAVITERPERMMWQIKAPNGTEINILGTIHITDDETNETFESSIYTLIGEADYIYGELASKDLLECRKKIQKLVLTDKVKDKNKKIIYAKDYLTEEEFAEMTEVVEKTLGDLSTPLVVKRTLRLPPWSLTSLIQSVCFKEAGVSSENGIDFLIYGAASMYETEVLGLDQLDDQLKLLHYGSSEDQIIILKSTLKEYKDSPEKLQKTVLEMITAYKNNDREGLCKIMKKSNEVDFEEAELEGLSKDYVKKYYNALITERNKKWAKQIKKMLKTSNKKYFIFTGAAHWISDDNVFDMLIKQGVAERQ